MGVNLKKTVSLIAAVIIGLGVTSGVLWFFAIEVSPLEHWREFPTGWNMMDLIMNAVAILMLFGVTRGAYRVLLEVWIRDRVAEKLPPSDQPD